MRSLPQPVDAVVAALLAGDLDAVDDAVLAEIDAGSLAAALRAAVAGFEVDEQRVRLGAAFDALRQRRATG